jgi:integrase
MAEHRGHNDGTIIERKNKNGDVRGYQAQISVAGGRRSHTAKTKAEARRWMVQAKSDAARGQLAARRPSALSAYLTEIWWPSIADKVKPRTRVGYALNVRRVPAWLGTKRLDELRPADFQRFYNDLTKAGKAPNTVRQVHMTMHKAMQDALRLDLVTRNPTEGVELPRLAQKEVSFYTEEQLAQLFRATSGDRFHGLWIVLGTLGIRLGEALGLKWSDINWQQGTVTLVRKLERDREQGALVLSELKTKYSRRTLHLGAGPLAALTAHRDRQDFARKKAGEAWQEQGLIFTTIYGGPLDQTRIHEHWTPAVAKAGLPRLNPHALRHSVASNLLRGGCELMKVARMLGHRNATMVLQVYGHLLPDEHRDASVMMDAMLSKQGAFG